MSLLFDLKRYYRITACLSLALGLIALPAADTWAKAKPRSAEARGAKAKPQAKPVPQRTRKPTPKLAPFSGLDPLTELEVISGEALILGNALAADADDSLARQKLAELALRALRAAERALSRGDDDLFAAYREQVRSRFAATRPRLESLAGRGVGAAEFALGTLLLHGFLEERDLDRACRHFAAALDKGFGGARFRHAQCIEESDPARALTLLTEAADSGHVAANESLGRICLDAEPPDLPCAFARLERAARDGRASATNLLGWMHAEGIGGTPDPVRAARYYREAAQRGELSAGNNLGELYEKGLGVVKDEKQAFELYLATARSGFAPAQFNVGRLYAAGRGTPRDTGEARRWLGEAQKAGIEMARQILDMLEQDAGK